MLVDKQCERRIEAGRFEDVVNEKGVSMPSI